MVTTGMRQVGRPAPLRLTRRGRVVVLTFFILLASLASAVLWTTASRADQPPGPAPTVVVQQGDTLWDIAARVAPDHSPRGVVTEIRELNAMSDYYIYAGDTLILPREH